MTKADLVEKVTSLGDLTRRDGEVIVDVLFEAVIGALKSGDKVEVRGFGSFRTRQRNSRIGRNPKSGARVEVPAKKVPFFKPSKELRDLINPTAKPSTATIDPHHPPPCRRRTKAFAFALKSPQERVILSEAKDPCIRLRVS